MLENICCNRTTVNFDNYKEKRNAVKSAARKDQRAKESEIAKDVKMKPKKFSIYVRQKNYVTKCNTSFSAR